VLFLLIHCPIICADESADLSKDELIKIGKEVYEEKGCSGCHKIAGVGGNIGPDLTNEGNILSHDAEWHRKHFKNPSSVTPGSIMPPVDLPPKKLDALIAYVMSLKSEELPADIERAIKRAHEELKKARRGIDEVKKAGFNVDDLEFKYTQAWTRLETINNMIYRRDLQGVFKQTEEAINLSKEIMKGVYLYKNELRHRITQSIILISLIVVIVVLLFLKILTL